MECGDNVLLITTTEDKPHKTDFLHMIHTVLA